MTKRYTNKGHLGWIHEQPCQLQSTACDGVTQAHHLLKPWDGVRGMGLKATDRNLVPLCEKHHRELHAAGNEDKFFETHTGSGAHGRNMAHALWLRSPFYEAKE